MPARTRWKRARAGYDGGAELAKGLGRYFDFYNCERGHSSLGMRTPQMAFFRN